MRFVTRILAPITALALILLGSLGSAAALPRASTAASPAQAQNTQSVATKRTIPPKGAPRGLTFPVKGVSKGGTITGAFTLKKLKKRHGVVTAKGTLRAVYQAPGKAPRTIKQKVNKVPVTISEATSAATSSSSFSATAAVAGAVSTAAVVPMQVPTGCDVLTLNLGPLHLDLLGLVVDLAPVDLAVTAVPGAGNLLGNLLCAVAGLLDPGAALRSLLNRVLDIINQVLGRLRAVVPAA